MQMHVLSMIIQKDEYQNQLIKADSYSLVLYKSIPQNWLLMCSSFWLLAMMIYNSTWGSGVTGTWPLKEKNTQKRRQRRYTGQGQVFFFQEKVFSNNMSLNSLETAHYTQHKTWKSGVVSEKSDSCDIGFF